MYTNEYIYKSTFFRGNKQCVGKFFVSSNNYLFNYTDLAILIVRLRPSSKEVRRNMWLRMAVTVLSASLLGRPLLVYPHVWKIVDDKLCLNIDAKIQEMWTENIPGNIKKADSNLSRIKENVPSDL